MNKEWSELNKRTQVLIKKESTFAQGIEVLLQLRQQLMNEILCFQDQLVREDFDAIPFMNTNGYHNKTIAYSIWHIFRIEDIVAHTLIQNDEQVFFLENYQERINAPLITTGNELEKQQIVEFSNRLDINELYQYIMAVKKSTDNILKKLSYMDLKRRMGDKDAGNLRGLEVVSPDEKANWLIDYWCQKDIMGLIQMPFSRHWIMHIEACLRIKNKIQSK